MQYLIGFRSLFTIIFEISICLIEKMVKNKWYPIPIKIRAPSNFIPLIFEPLIFAHPQISCPFNFCSPLIYCKFAVFSFICGIFLLPLIFAHSYCENLLPLIFAQTRCAKIKGTRILMGIRYIKKYSIIKVQMNLYIWIYPPLQSFWKAFYISGCRITLFYLHLTHYKN